MKIKKIVDMCRREGIARIYKDEGDIQWLGNGYAMYPLYDVPELSEDEFYAVFDFTRKQRGDVVFEITDFPAAYCTQDQISNELPCEKLSQRIPFGQKLLIPFKTIRGIEFLDSDYLAPLADEGHEIEVYERITPDGTPYFAIKIGLCLRAIVLPFHAINKPFVDNLEEIYLLCREALEK